MPATRATVTPTVPAARLPWPVHLLLRPLRLQLRPATPAAQARGMVDGAWWPYTDDLVTELAPLLAGMAARGHLVHRVSYSLGAWRTVPRKMHIAGALVRLGGYRTQSPAVIHLIDSSGKAPLVLVVIPPATPAADAASALELAVLNDALDGSSILDAVAR